MRIANRSINRATLLVGGLLGCGVAATLAREMLLARMFGTGAAIETFRLSFAIPNLLGTSLAPVVVAALVPQFSRHADTALGRAAALRDTLRSTTLLAVLLGGAGIVTAPWQAAAMAPAYDTVARGELAGQISILWCFFILLALSFGPRAFLSFSGRVWPMASSNLVLGGTMTIGLLLATLLPAESRDARMLALLAIAAASVVLLVHIVALGPAKLGTLFMRGAGDERIRLAHFTLLPVLGGHLLAASPRLIDRSIATGLEAGTVAALDFSYAIITVPGIAFGTVFVMVAVPRLAAALREGDRKTKQLLAGRAAASIALAAIAGAILAGIAPWLIGTLYAGGEFDSASAALTERILFWHALSLGPMVATIILAQASLALGLVTAFLAVAACRLLVKWAAVEILVPALGTDGLAASFLVPELASTLLLLGVIAVAARRKPGSLP